MKDLKEGKLDIIYITNFASFYKINLLNHISQRLTLLAVFTESWSTIRREDFFSGNRLFEYKSIGENFFLVKIIKLLRIFISFKYNRLIIGGWDSWIFWILVFARPKEQNCLILESSVMESSTRGLKGFLKRCFLTRVNTVYCSGSLQHQLLVDLNYKGKVIITGGVGIHNMIKQPAYFKCNIVLNFVYVGRLAEEKNLEFLVSEFSKLPHLNLHIIGHGPMDQILQKMATPNVIFHGSVLNKDLIFFLQKMHVLILPSISEPWGLVVEEALNCGIPVIVSDKVGCVKDVVAPGLGLIYSNQIKNSLESCINKMLNLEYYNNLRLNISLLDFEARALAQVQNYLHE